MTVGSFGDLIFKVSAEQVVTFENMSWETNARWAEHERHLNEPLLEWLGNQNDKMTFPMTLTVFAGTNPLAEIVKILNMKRSGEPHYLVIGSKGYGKGRWVIQKATIDMKRFDNQGQLLEATVSVTLLAYPGR
jgi:phage protein U